MKKTGLSVALTTPHSSNTIPPTRRMWQQWQDRGNIIIGASNSHNIVNTPNKYSCVYSQGKGVCRRRDRQNSLLCYVQHLLTHHNVNIREDPNFDLLHVRSSSVPAAAPVSFKSRNPLAVVLEVTAVSFKKHVRISINLYYNSFFNGNNYSQTLLGVVNIYCYWSAIIIV